MKNKIYICLVVIVMLFLVGCGSTTSSDRQNFKQGISELQISLLENAPPERIYPNSEFRIIAQVHNQAGYDIKDGKLTITGNFDNYFEIPEDKFEFGGILDQNTLQGRSLTAPVGEKTFVEFEGFSKSLFLNAEQQRQVFFLKATYNSDMEFSDTVCINPNLYGVYNSGCEVATTKSYSGQGAPITVNRMEELISPGAAAQVEFRIFLRNSGKGKLRSLELKSAQLGGKEIDCEFRDGLATTQGKVNFSEGKTSTEKVLICKALVGGKGAYETTLLLRFAYDYELRQQHSLNLVR